jgi:hypothetical protein
MPAPVNPFDADRCPLCGQPNDCRLCATGVYKGPCWCAAVEIPAALLERVPPEARNRACLCRDCVLTFQTLRSATGRGFTAAA